MEKTISNLLVRRILNYPVESNCFVVYKEGYSRCIIVDPACKEGTYLDTWLSKNKLLPEFIILTHEHFDHIRSVELLRRKYPCKVVSSFVCSLNITNSKSNLSLFQDQVGFCCEPSDIVIHHNRYCLEWHNTTVKFYLTPGHSEGGMCFSIGNNLFTGDTLLQKHKTIVKLPGGSKLKLRKSLELLTSLLNEDMIVFPGHGEAFAASEIDSSIINQ